MGNQGEVRGGNDPTIYNVLLLFKNLSHAIKLTSFWFSLDQKDQVPGVPRIGLQSQSEQ